MATSDNDTVTFDSEALRLLVAHDPRGEIDVRVVRRRNPSEGTWSYSGMVGRASEARLLELAAMALADEPMVLAADDAYFEGLAEKQVEQSAEWTAYYSCKGPRPGTGGLS
jgi:hypothetical protein